MTKKVALIGCGPSGMFFLHALAHRRRRLLREGDDSAADALPSVTCFERSSSPGGLWRSNRRAGGGDMYEALWTNGSKECKEFFDYTFDEHFGRAMPTYLPRALVLEYILARCTRDDPGFFNDVKFETPVESVHFDDGLGRFVVRTTEHSGEGVAESLFDACVWAAGTNGVPYVPDKVSEVLSAGGFAGRTMHSSETGPDFDRLVRGGRVLMIGDAYSAEDLTLQAIKLGVERVHVCSRSGTGIVYYTGSWPRDCVEVHYDYAPTGVTNYGHGIVLSNGKEEIALDAIEVVIYCTGFSPKMDMLHTSLRPAPEGPFFSGYEIPKDWKMPKNALSKEFGDVPMGRILEPPFVMDDVYRGRLISNPDMMFLMEITDVPLLDLDVQAWLLLAQITGDLPLPSIEAMKEYNLATLLEAMKDPVIRGNHDENYENRWWEVDDNHWSYDMSDERSVRMNRRQFDFQFRLMARDMVDSNYPLQIGTYGKLNRKGRALVEFNMATSHARYDLDPESPDSRWRTFRDSDASQFYSIITGTRAAPLRCWWLDLDGDGKDNITDASRGDWGGKGGRSLKGMARFRPILARIHRPNTFA